MNHALPPIDIQRLFRLVRPLLHGWFLLSRGLTLGVRGAVIDDDGRVMLVRHTYVGGWQLPGGGVEIGETAADAMIREVREECAIAVTGPMRLHGVFHNGRISRRDHVLVYVIERFDVLGPKTPDREIAEARFFALDDLPPGTTFGTQDRLDEIVSGRTAAETLYEPGVDAWLASRDGADRKSSA